MLSMTMVIEGEFRHAKGSYERTLQVDRCERYLEFRSMAKDIITFVLCRSTSIWRNE